MINSEFGDVPLESPWLSNPELSPGTGYFQWQHVPPGDFPITLKEEYMYTDQGP